MISPAGTPQAAGARSLRGNAEVAAASHKWRRFSHAWSRAIGAAVVAPKHRAVSRV